jgi:hypothetical protein
MRLRLSQQRWPWVAVAALVLLGHVLVTEGIASHMRDMSANNASGINRMEAEFVADMQLTEPPVMATPAPAMAAAQEAVADMATEAASKPKPSKKSKTKAEVKAPPPPSLETSAAEAAAEPAKGQYVAVDIPPPVTLPTDQPPVALQAQPAASAASSPAFVWPKATRVTYKVEGYFRGEAYGNAQVEWIKQGERYQVHVDASIGPSFAPLGSQRWTSEGVITPEGLAPERFESINKLLIKSAPPKVVNFSATEVELPSGEKVPKMAGVQDPSSHYIQLAYQFIRNPEKLEVGKVIEVPMAWTRRQEVIFYDVMLEEDLDTPLGKLHAFKLKPRRMNDTKGDVLAEIWLAPALQYLPIRMYLRQGPENYLDMVMDKAPQQVSGDAPN